MGDRAAIADCPYCFKAEMAIQPAQVNVGDEFTVSVTVTHTGADGYDIKNVRPAGPLAMSGDGAAVVVSGPEPASAATLKHPGTVTFTYTLKATSGDEVHIAVVIEQSSDSRTVTAEGQIQIEGSAAFVSVTASPNNFEQDEVLAGQGLEARGDTPEAGPVPQDITVTVTVTNIFEDEIYNVIIQALDKSALIPEAGLSSCNLVPVNVPPIGGDDLGTLAVDESKSKEYLMRAMDDGECELRALVTGTTEPGLSQTDIVETGIEEVRVRPKFLLLFDAHFPEGTSSVEAGKTVQVFATIESLTTTRRIELPHFLPERTGNAGGAWLHDMDSEVEKTECAAPFSGTLDPGQKVFLEGRVQTIDEGLRGAGEPSGTHATITYTPEGKLLEWDDTKAEIEKTRIFPNEIEMNLSIFYPPISPLTTTEAIVYGFFGFTPGMGSGLVQGLQGLSQLPGMIGTAIWNSPVYAMQLYAYLADYWQAVNDLTGLDYLPPPLQLAGLEALILADIINKASEATPELVQQINQVVEETFTKTYNAYYTGDWMTWSDQMMLFGNFTGQLAFEVITEVAMCHVSKLGSQVLNLADEARKKGLAGKLRLAAKVEDAGEILDDAKLASRFRIWPELAAKLRAYAESRGLIITMKKVSFRAEEHLRTGRALPKPQNLKGKTVTDVDVMFLGYLDDDLGYAMLKRPDHMTPLGTLDEVAFREDFLNKYPQSGLPADRMEEVYDAAWARANLRAREWSRDLAKLKTLHNKGKVTLDFEPRLQGIDPDEFPVFQPPREYNFRLLEDPPGSERYFPQVEVEPGQWRPFAGDVDLIDVRKANGDPLSRAERAKIYEETSDPLFESEFGLQLQHGETTVFVVDGSTVLSPDQIDLLLLHQPGGEALAQIGPDGVWRQVYIDPDFSFFQTDNLNRAWFHGGYRHPVAIAHQFELGLQQILSKVRAPYVFPLTWPLRHPGEDGQEGPGACSGVRLDNSEDALAIRDNLDTDALETLTPDGWEATDLDEACSSPLYILPQSALADEHAAGDTDLIITDLFEIAPYMFPDGRAVDWFQPHQRILIDPGGENEEYATVASVEDWGLALSTALQAEHEANEMVVVRPADYPDVFLPGDVDCGGDVNSVDALAILRSTAGLAANVDCLTDAGDVDCDDDADAVDALNILRHVAGLDVALPPGCPEIGG